MSRKKISFLICFTINILCFNQGWTNSSDTAEDLGDLKSIIKIKNKGEHYYQFNLSTDVTVSVFLNGLSAGYKLELIHNNVILNTSSNKGIDWQGSSKPGKVGGVIVQELVAGSYLIHIIPIVPTGNPKYHFNDGIFVLNIIPDNLPNMITVAANDSSFKGKSTYTAIGEFDELTINQAIKEVGISGGTVLLRPGTYNIHQNVLITYDNITLMGTGWSTILKLAPNVELDDAGLLRSAFPESRRNFEVTHFDNQHFLHMSLDGNKEQGTSYHNDYGTFGTYTNSSFEDMRIHDFPHYGFDPHHNPYANIPTMNILIEESLSDHNVVDGMTTDTCIYSIFRRNIIDSNGRHGINVCTGANHNTYLNNIITNNGANGIVIQPGSNLNLVSNEHSVIGNEIQGNQGIGVLLYRTRENQIENNLISSNGKHGVDIHSSSNNKIYHNTLIDNSQKKPGFYRAIFLSDDLEKYSVYNEIIGNDLLSTVPAISKTGIAESNENNDFNVVRKNKLKGFKFPILIRGLHSISKDNEVVDEDKF